MAAQNAFANECFIDEVAAALTALLQGEITFKQGAVEQSNFNNYPLLHINEMPEVKVHIVKSIRDPKARAKWVCHH